jgi:hypothetical protein
VLDGTVALVTDLDGRRVLPCLRCPGGQVSREKTQSILVFVLTSAPQCPAIRIAFVAGTTFFFLYFLFYTVSGGGSRRIMGDAGNGV